MLCFAGLITAVVAEDSIPQMTHNLLLADEGNGKVHHINLSGTGDKWSAALSNRDMQLIGNDRILVGSNAGNGYSILSLSTGAVQRTVKVSGATGINSVFMVSGNELYCTCDGNPAKIIRIDSTGKTVSTITLSIGASVRICRPTPDTTFLVGGKVAGMMYEFDGKGNKIWECNAGGEPYMALRLADGNTLISNGYGGQMVLADHSGTVLRKFPSESDKQKNPAFWEKARPNFFAGFQVLQDGTIVVSNWEGHGTGHGNSGYQLIGINSTLTGVVSYWKQDATLVSSLHGVLVLDGLDTRNAYTDRSGPLTALTEQVDITQYDGHPVPCNRIVPAIVRKFDLLGRTASVNRLPARDITVTVSDSDNNHHVDAFINVHLTQ